MRCCVCNKEFNASHVARDLNNNIYCSIECFVNKVTNG
jgi:hypothetical protein